MLRCVCTCLLVGCMVTGLLAQAPSSEYTIRFAKPDPDRKIQIHYFLSGAFQHFANKEVPGTILDSRGPSFATIPTLFDATDVTRISGYVYQPGCRVTYLSVTDFAKQGRILDLPCVAADPVELHIKISNPDDLPGGDLVADIDYFGLRERNYPEIDTTIFNGVSFHLGSHPLAEDGTLTAVIEDFGSDPVIQNLKHGHFQILVRQKYRGPYLGWLIVPHEPVQHFLSVARIYPAVVQLRFSTINKFE